VAHQLQLTVADWLVETHDAHHPIGGAFYYEDQKPESKRRAAHFTAERLPKFLGYFRGGARRERSGWLLGKTFSYADISLFQMIAGLRYAFPGRCRGWSRNTRGRSRFTAASRRGRALPLISRPSGASPSISTASSGIILSSTFSDPEEKVQTVHETVKILL